MLSSEELKRYNRHLILSEVGKEGQERLKAAKVLVIGAGGLGCPVLQYLGAAGVGTIGIVDFDTVDESNLQRQILFSTEDVGKYKAEVAASKLKKQNPFIDIKVFKTRLCAENALDIFGGFDIIVDGSDNFPTRYLVNDACVILNKPLVFGSIFKFEGQVSVFNYTSKGERGPTYRCLFPEPPSSEEVPNCSQIGVIGVLPGVIGCFQANETIKIILQKGDVLSGKLLIWDALSMQSSILSFGANEENFKINSFTDYEEFCGVEKEIELEYEAFSVNDLKKWQDSGKDFCLLDVREDFERDICSLGGIHIPMRNMQSQVELLPMDKPVIVYCHHGMRSAMIVKFLKEEFNFKNLINLEGGIHAWASEIDSDMEMY